MVSKSNLNQTHVTIVEMKLKEMKEMMKEKVKEMKEEKV